MTDGYFRIAEDDDLVYYSPDGTEAHRFKGGFTSAKGTGFYRGLAFVQTSASIGETNAMIIDTDFETVRLIDNSTGYYRIVENGPEFKDGLALVNNTNTFINPEGMIEIQSVPADKANFRPFSDGYSFSQAVLNGIGYSGFIRTDGEFSVVFSKDASKNRGPFDPNEPIDTVTPHPREPLPTPKPKPRIPKIITSLQPYKLNVVASPTEGGTATGSGQYKYGSKATLTATANEGWKFAGYEPSSGATQYPGSTDFVITDNATVLAKFIKETTVTAPAITGAWQGEHPYTYVYSGEYDLEKSIPYYLELKDTPTVETPYGNKYGFFTIIVDPDKVYSATSKRGTSYANMLYIPMSVEGMINEDNKQWLLLEGGGPQLGNIMVSSALNSTETAAANLALLIFGNGVKLDPATYRVEITIENDGTISLGSMQRFHPLDGWIPAGSERFYHLKVFGWTWGIDKGLPQDFLRGIRLKPVNPRSDILWFPPKSWTWNDDEQHSRLIQSLRKIYKKYVSDYLRFNQQ